MPPGRRQAFVWLDGEGSCGNVPPAHSLCGAFSSFAPGAATILPEKDRAPEPRDLHAGDSRLRESDGRAGLEPIFTGALRREFLLRSRIRLVPRREAEAVFLGRITRLSTSSVAHRKSQDTILTRLTVTLDVRCVDNRTQKVLWQDRSLTYYQDYIQDSDPWCPSKPPGALETAARDLAVRIHDRFLSRF